jgi:AdoMet-dependent rRNA methyltransferase SPB1
MPKKTKSKARLDKFYTIAKEQGYRSRAAFKLIQINQKYDLLNGATVVIDLCAAPGSWLQVCSKYMPSSSIILGFDLDPIPNIPKVKTFIEDITTEKCYNVIRRELQHFKADLVLNDGAPNVGQDWKKDAYGQAELVLHSLKLATKFLRKGGNFCTKVFRSTDYNSIIWVISKFFDRVEANKPEASRGQSAEIFVIGLGFKAPDEIDQKYFDPAHVFKDTEADFLTSLLEKEVNSIDKIFLKRKKRYIDDNMPLTMFRRLSFKDFLAKRNPYSVFVEFNQITFDKTDEEAYLSLAKYPDDYKE